MLRDDLPPRRTGRDRAKWPPHVRTRPQALIPHLETSSARECSTTREAASTGFGVLWFIFDALSNAPPTRASGAGLAEISSILDLWQEAIKVRREISRALLPHQEFLVSC